VRNATVAAAAELGVSPLASAGYSITFWTEVGGAPADFLQVLQVTPGGDAGFGQSAPAVWVGGAGEFYITQLNSAMNEDQLTSTMNEDHWSAPMPFNQRFLVGLCFTPSSLTLRVRGVGGFALVESTTYAGTLRAFLPGAKLYVASEY
jgi:hypothetical protein